MKQVFPEPTVGALIFYKGRALLVKGKQSNDLYVIPGGHIEVNETIDHALRREVLEETGLHIKKAKLFGIQECIGTLSNIKNRHYIFIDYICESTTDKVVLNNEHKMYLWIKKSKLLEQKLNRYTKRFIEEYMNGTKSKYSKKIIFNYY